MPTRFLATEEVGRLARWLRLMGHDTVSVKGAPLTALYRKAYHEQRLVVTRNRRIRASGLFRVIHLDSPLLEAQLQQLLHERVISVDEERWFTRCDLCNVAVEPIDKACVKDRVPPYVYHSQPRFWTCPSCRRIYWAATHYQRARSLMEKLKQ